MSTLKVDNIRHNSATSDAITMASDGTCTAKITSINGGSQLSHRNKIHNGSFIINQRGGPYTSTGSENMMDRFSHGESASFTFDTTTTVDSSGPAGFRKSLKITPDSTQTPTGGQNAFIGHRIEGQDLQDLCFGTSSAKKITISFYAKSSSQNNNHQYTLQIRKYDDSNNRNMVNRAFTVTSSWQRFIMTFDGDTAENIRNDNGAGMQILWHLSTGPDDIHGASTTFGRTVNNSLYSGVTGQSNFMDNTSNEFYLTGVQLEVGDTATSFEHRSFTDELTRCQRYFVRTDFTSHCTAYFGGTHLFRQIQFACPTPMRAAPTFSVTGNEGGTTKFTLKTWSSDQNMTATPSAVHRHHTDYVHGTTSDAVHTVSLGIDFASSDSGIPPNGPGNHNVYACRMYGANLDAEL